MEEAGGRYLLQASVGHGRGGQVFRAIDKETGETVAIRVLSPELVSDQDAIHKLLMNYSRLTAIRHANIARVIELATVGEAQWVVMELVNGPSLRRYLAQWPEGPEPAVAARLSRQLFSGVTALHAAGLAHGDLRPENLLIETTRSAGTLKITDVGIQAGRPPYAAPEVVRGGEPTIESDQYSLGIVLGEIWGGQAPIEPGDSDADALWPPKPLLRAPAQISELVEALLAPDPRWRPSSAQAAAGLANLASAPARPSGAGHLPPTPGRRDDRPHPEPPEQESSLSPTVVRSRYHARPLDKPDPGDDGGTQQRRRWGLRPQPGGAKARGKRAALIALVAAAVAVVVAVLVIAVLPAKHVHRGRLVVQNAVVFYSPGDQNWWFGRFTKTGTLIFTKAANTSNLGDTGQDPTWTGNFTGTSQAQVLFYSPAAQNWWLGSFTRARTLTFAKAANTSGFGNTAPDPTRIGYFTSTSRKQVLFYSPGDQNWWLGSFTKAGTLTFAKAANTSSLGKATDESTWTGNFTGTSRSQVLFYSSGDRSWWLGSFTKAGTLTFAKAADTPGFGNTALDPTRIGSFTGTSRSQVLFYSPGDQNWWLGSFTKARILTFAKAANTSGFGNTASDRLRTGNFTGTSRSQVLFYSPGDQNWWLGSVTKTGTLTFAKTANTSNLGDTASDPTWTGYFSGTNRSQVLFYSPATQNWWLGSVSRTGTLTFAKAANTSSFGNTVRDPTWIR